MQSDEATPPLPTPDDRAPAPFAPQPMVRRLAADLDAWQAWEIDGETVDSAKVPASTIAANIDDANSPHIPDLADEALLVSLPARRWQVAPGGAVTLPITVLNNSAHPHSVRAHLEGWLDDRWAVEPYLQAVIAPGERRTLDLTLAPPRQSSAEAGDYQLAVVVRSLEEPAHRTRIGLVLSVLPFDRLQLDLTDAAAQRVTWWRRTLVLPVHLANQGNRAIRVRLDGDVPPQLGRVVFPDGDGAHLEVALQPGQRTRTPLQLTVTRLPLAALHSRELPFVVTARDEAGKLMRQQRGAVEVRPILGAWQMASLFGLTVAGGVAATLLVVVGVLFAWANSANSQVAAPAAAAVPAIPAVIVVTLNQPVAAPAANTAANTAASTAPSLANALQSQPDPALPLVLPDQVTSPGSGGPIRPAAPAIAEAASAETAAAPADPAASSAPLTYAQMFQAVGAQYDLDWRMLAAQAYIESSFDALALSSAGAMGLMQVLPSTWREWAPAVSASDPFDSYSNVQVAAVYLDYLRGQLAQQGHPEKEWMLVAYNWGLDRVNEFLASGGAWQDLPEARRKYAEDILRIAQTLP